MFPTARQIRAARGLLGLTQEDLAKQANVGYTSLRRIESGRGDPRVSTLKALQSALEAQGVQFLPSTDSEGEGVRMKKPCPREV